MISRFQSVLFVALTFMIVGAFPERGLAGNQPPDKVERTGHQWKNWYSNVPQSTHHGVGCGCKTCYARPHKTSSCLYGYQDYAYGRGPVIDLGAASMQPGFRGYGPIGSPGYGLGMRPTSELDQRANARGWKLFP